MLILTALSASAAPQFKDHGVAAPVAESRGFVVTQDAQGRNLGIACALDMSEKGYLLATDLDSGETEQVLFPEGVPNSPPFASMLSKNGRFYTGAGKVLLEFDPNTRTFLFHGIPDQATGCFVGEAFADGPDGLIYIGSYPDCHLLSYDPKTHEMKDYGQLDPEEKYFNYLAFDDQGWAYAGIGTARCNIVACNPKTGEKKQILPEGERKHGTAQVYRAADGRVYGLALGNTYRMSGGQAEKIERSAVAPKAPSGVIGWGASTGKLPDGRMARLDLPNSVITVTSADGQETRRLPLRYASGGAQITSLVTGPDGKVYGSSAHPMHFFAYDPAADKLADLGPVRRIGGGNFCAMDSQGVYVAASSYSHGIFHLFDTTLPFNGGEGNAPNPREVAEWHEDICRPRATLAHPDGKHVLMAGYAGYGLVGGGLGIYNIETETATLIKHEQLIPNQSTIALQALPDGNLVGGTTIEAPGGGHPLAEEAVLYLFDWPTRKVAFQTAPVPGAGAIVSLEIGSDGYIYGVAAGKLFVFDLQKRQVIHTTDMESFGGITRPGMVRAPDGNIYATMNKGVVRIAPKTFTCELIAEAPTPMTAGPALLQGRLYYAGNAHVWSVPLEAGK
jgi:hypothetical protein